MMRGNKDIQAELERLGSRLAEIPVNQVFTVPDGYFDRFPDLMLQKVKALESDEATAEIAAVSPLLAGLSRKMPMSVPADYFGEVKIPVTEQAPVIQLPKSRIRIFAIAASVVALLGFGALLFMLNSREGINPDLSVSKELPKVSEKEMDEFLGGFADITIAEPIVVAGSPSEAEEMMQDIDEAGLKDFLADQPDLTPHKLN